MKKIIMKVGAAFALLGTGLLSSSCAQKAKESLEPVHVSVHDPSIFRGQDADGKPQYYMFGTHIIAATSKDLASWSVFTNGYTPQGNTLYGDLSKNLSEPFAWAGEDDSDCRGGFAVWAPDVIYNERYLNEDGSRGAYLMYFCTSSTYCRSAIAYAVSDRIDSGYVYKGTLVYSGFTAASASDPNSDHDKIWTNTHLDELMASGRIDAGFDSNWATSVHYNTDYAPNAIDPTVFTDKNGRMWMCYGSWSGGIYLLEVDPETGDVIYPKTTAETADGRVIDKYFGTRIAAGHTKSSEGPYILYDKATDYYYLYTTYNFLDAKSGYNMRLFRAKDPEGPYLDAAGNSAIFDSRKTDQYALGIKVMGNYSFSCLDDGYRSPGHCSALIDADGAHYLFYHTRFDKAGDRFQTRVHQQFLSQAGWPVTAVFEYRGDKIRTRGYSKEAIVGTYEFINHGTESDGASVRLPVQIALNEDGSISGEVQGQWEQKRGTCYAAITIADELYEGVFFLQHDESQESKLVMTFTAIGANNKTVWGVRTAE